ncbi:MAG TPA: PH domain-containing protein [Microthrixaceae bacterium]|nr:PH domain-containing protein [Microthrixaceae bacterium]
MAFKTSNLYREEKLILDLHPHWVMLAEGVVLLVGSIIFGIWVKWGWGPEKTLGSFAYGATAVLVIGSLLYFLQRWITWISTEFVVTTDRCIFREGIIAKRGIEIPLERINTIFFNQGIIDRMVGAGTLTIESAGENGVQTFTDVRRPMMVQQTLYEQMEDNENRKFDRVRGPAQLSVADEVAKLVVLRDQGHLSPEEFAAQKAALLSKDS